MYEKLQIPPPVYLSLPPTRQDLTHGQRPEGQFIVGVKGEVDRARAETRNLLYYAGHRLIEYNVSLMSLARHGLKREYNLMRA